MAEEYAIEVSHISKSFKIFLDKGHELKDYVATSKRGKHEKRQVLKDISFNVRKGEAVGLIGHNGCGKSTTLKLLTRIMYPDSGTIKMQGRVSSLIELGAGFHPDMSGRENIYINASIFGLTKKEIDRRLDDIIAFSELEEFIDNPVRTYSSGMYMRLAFSVAINVDADILLIDEILAVGDVNFQAKCFNRLREIKGQGTTIVIVSHSLAQIEQICDRTIWIDKGLIREEGIPTTVNKNYLEYMGNKSRKIEVKSSDNVKTKKGEEINKEVIKVDAESRKQTETKILRVYLCNEAGEEKEQFRCGEKVLLKIKYKAKLEELDDPLIGLKFIRNDGIVCYGTNTQRERIKNIPFKKEGELTCCIDKLNLVAGEYWIDVAIRNFDMFPLDYSEKGCRFRVYSSVDEIGIAKLEHDWNFEG